MFEKLMSRIKGEQINDGRVEKKEAIAAKFKAAHSAIRITSLMRIERRVSDLPFYGPDRREMGIE